MEDELGGTIKQDIPFASPYNVGFFPFPPPSFPPEKSSQAPCILLKSTLLSSPSKFKAQLLLFFPNTDGEKKIPPRLVRAGNIL